MLLDQALPIHCCRSYCLVKVRSDITISLAVPVGNMKRDLYSDWPILPALIPTSSRSIKTQKRELGQYPAILTSSLVDNAYFTTRKNHQHLNSIEVIIDLQCTIFFLSYSQNLPSWISYWTSAEFFGRVSAPVHMFSPFIYRYKD